MGNAITLILRSYSASSTGRMCSTHRSWQTNLFHTLFAGFIHTHNRIQRVIRAFINLKYLLHRAHEGGLLLQRDTPHFLAPGFDGVFLKPCEPTRVTPTAPLSFLQFITQQMQCPPGLSLWRLATAMATTSAPASPSDTTDRSRLLFALPMRNPALQVHNAGAHSQPSGVIPLGVLPHPGHDKQDRVLLGNQEE